MGNNGNCDVCSDTASRGQMDMRRQKAMMYDCRYGSGQTMSKNQGGCLEYGRVGLANGCAKPMENRNTCNTTKIEENCNTCGSTRVMNHGNNCETARMTTHVNTCTNGNMKMNHSYDDCGNSMQDELQGMPIAMGYVPWQNFSCAYEPMQALHAGTMFPELEKPFYGRKGMR